MIEAVTAQQLETLITTGDEHSFLLVDVRLAEEYRLDHIPGAINIPLAELEFDPFVLDDQKKKIFYCRRESRSKVAALFASEAGQRPENLFYLQGGMAGYTGEILLEIPRVDLFSPLMSPAEVMEKAISFERGAFHFYGLAMEKFKGSPLYPVMEKMSLNEKAHARTIFNVLDKIDPVGLSFDRFFETCREDILEGGKSLEEINRFLDRTSPENRMDLLEFAIELEFCAYDLYKTMAENSKEAVVKEMFYTLSQAEKQHLSLLVNHLGQCS